MRSRKYIECDVFGARPYSGNPCGIVLDADGLTTDEMQYFARWTNFSETTFIFPPITEEADYRLRIFTPTTELPFAGHPTLGSCHAWLSQGNAAKSPGSVKQECGVGLVSITTNNDQLAFAAPGLLRGGPIEQATLVEVLEAINIDPNLVVDTQYIDNGPGWIGVLLPSAKDVLAVRPLAHSNLQIGIFGPYEPGHAYAYEVRAFFPEDGKRNSNRQSERFWRAVDVIKW